MTYIEIILLALALSVDACVVSFTYGLYFDKNRMKNMMLLASFTSIFQGLMPCFGYFLASVVKSYISPYSKWIIFLIFVFLGLKFIKEAFEENKKPDCINLPCLFLIGIATSIDAFSAGISLFLYGNHILKPVLLIGIVTFINSALGFSAGKLFQTIPSKWLEISAGLVMIILGIKAIL